MDQFLKSQQSFVENHLLKGVNFCACFIIVFKVLNYRVLLG